MREIKFKALIKNECFGGDYIVNVDKIDFQNQEVWFRLPPIIHHRDFKDVELLQWTGFKDVGGVEIYEGDIIERQGNESFRDMSLNSRGYVIFEDGAFTVERREHKVLWNKGKYLPYLDWPNEAFENCKVIGNKSLNPELLED